ASDAVVTLNVLKPHVVFGDRVALRGTVTPAEPGVRVVLIRDGLPLVHARTDSTGRYTAWLRPGRTGLWRARAGGAVSAPVRIDVSPRLRIETGTATAFVGAKVVVRATPRTSGRADLH